MINRLKVYTTHIELSILFLLFISLNLPYFHISIVTLPLSLYIVYRNKEFLQIDNQLISFFYLFVIYLILFSIYSLNYSLSAKGSFDVLKTAVVFMSAVVFFAKINEFRSLKNFFLFLSLIYLLGNFFFDRGSHFNYYENSNSGAINVFFILAVSFYLFEVRKFWNNILILCIALVSIFLIFYANSRGVILSSFISVLTLTIVFSNNKIRYTILTIATSLIAIFLFFINTKGFGLSNRGEIWLPLINYTIENNLLFGNGINTTKTVIKLVDSFTHIAHNIFVEIFSSSGLLGLLFVLFIFYKTFKYFLGLKYEKNTFYFISLFNLISLIVMFQIDLKFYAYPYLGLIMVSLAGLYSSKINIRKENN